MRAYIFISQNSMPVFHGTTVFYFEKQVSSDKLGGRRILPGLTEGDFI